MKLPRREWTVPTALILLSVIPILGGALRVAELSSGAEVTPANARFVAMPVPVLLHIVGASVFCVLGAFQFHAGLRRRRPAWHRRAGRVLVLCGLTAALSGLWMAAFYPLPAGDEPLVTVFRFVFGSAMAASIVVAFLAIRRGDLGRHRAWMTRGYAIAQGAGTQALVLLSWAALAGTPTARERALLMAAAWTMNLVVVELILRRRPVVRPRPALAVAR
jgi:uncharacterized membrane protein